MSAAVVPIAACNAAVQSCLGLGVFAENLGSLYFWLAVTVVLLMGLGLVGAAILKRLRAPLDVAMGPAFSLADLRRLRDQGQLSEEEYERAKKRVLAQMVSSGGIPADDKAPAADAAEPAENGLSGEDDASDAEPPPTIR